MHNMTNTVTYITDTNHDPHTHYILSRNDRQDDTQLRFWFEDKDVLPGDEIADFREALIRAAMRLNGEDREFLADNGFILTTIPMIWNEDNLWLPYSTQIIDISYEILKALMKYRVVQGHADTFRTLSVLDHMGSAIVSIIEPLECEIKGERERRYQ